MLRLLWPDQEAHEGKKQGGGRDSVDTSLASVEVMFVPLYIGTPGVFVEPRWRYHNF